MKGLGHLPSIDNLRCFLAAAEHLNFRRAAEQMALTPTAFGQRIQKLEELLDQRLFERTTRHVELTAAGRRLLGQARQTVQQARRCAEVVHREEEAPARFTVGTRFELGLSWIVPALQELREVHPNWHVDLYFGSGSDILDELRAGKVDCVVTSAPVAERKWHAEFLHPEEYVFVAAPDLLDKTPFDEPDHAREHVLLDIDRTLPLTRYLTSVTGELKFDQVWMCGAGGAMHRLVLDAAGVAVLPLYMVEDDLQEGRLVRLLPEVELLSDSFRLLYRDSSSLQGVLWRFAEFMRGRPLE
ncbi:LysR family transcriptional regulator [Persicimonas caeni]|uniref:LysR family transcriptional regulator n=1 Tax=Persicimonas caeni TaxID=2292766 RepID=A0A4Y6PYZ9_PERCE|nr:LysR family transcriptional regulator [Persicimonas caeni]QDG53556.1 LysR family transcriptional regulator [Persicimonas caeni]QED34777.1 LysR family transcriptional regulator [Persicimonas caeni]